MKFPFIPISYLIADIRAELKKMDLTGEINDEDCQNYIVEAMREIGGANYPDKTDVLFVRNNVAQLPKDFYVADKLYLCANTGSVIDHRGIWFSKEGKMYAATGILFPGDAATGSTYMKHRNVKVFDKSQPTYIIKHPLQFRCSLDSAIVGIDYVSMPMTEDGQMLIQDEINTIKASKAYAKKMLLSERFYEGRLAQYIWNDLKDDHESYTDQAQAIFKFPDHADDEARGIYQDNRYNAFNLE